jgi:hypothetical protein
VYNNLWSGWLAIHQAGAFKRSRRIKHPGGSFFSVRWMTASIAENRIDFLLSSI